MKVAQPPGLLLAAATVKHLMNLHMVQSIGVAHEPHSPAGVLEHAVSFVLVGNKPMM